MLEKKIENRHERVEIFYLKNSNIFEYTKFEYKNVMVKILNFITF